MAAGLLAASAICFEAYQWPAYDSTTDGVRYRRTMVTGTADMYRAANGTSHSLSLKTDGSVWTWGSNSVGQLGQPLTTPMSHAAMKVLGVEGFWILGDVLEHELAVFGQ